MNFVIGNRVSGYLVEDGLPFLGYISAFDGEEEGTKRKLIRVCLELKDKDGKDLYDQAYLDSCHHMPLDEIKHNKATFLAAASRCGPSQHFKSMQDRRDYLEALWVELQNFTQRS